MQCNEIQTEINNWNGIKKLNQLKTTILWRKMKWHEMKDERKSKQTTKIKQEEKYNMYKTNSVWPPYVVTKNSSLDSSNWQGFSPPPLINYSNDKFHDKYF